MRAWRVLWCVLLYSCVLPDYHIVERTAAIVSKDPDAGTSADAGSAPEGFAAAPSECPDCAAHNCNEERTACGKSCTNMPWPVSPAWEPTEKQAAFVKCLTNKCDAQCNVTWGCVGSYAWSEPREPYSVSFKIGSAFTEEPDVGGRVTACQASDPGCSAGIGRGSSEITDENGSVTLLLSPGFSGYLLIEPHDPKYYPMTMVWSRPIYRLDRSLWINLFERSWLDAMADSLHVPKDDSAGHVIFRTENCLPLNFLGDQESNAEADDVRVLYSPSRTDSTDVFYTRYALTVDSTLKATKATGGAYGGALNLRPGSISLLGLHEDEDVMHVTLRLRPDTLALVHLVPDSR